MAQQASSTQVWLLAQQIVSQDLAAGQQVLSMQVWSLAQQAPSQTLSLAQQAVPRQVWLVLQHCVPHCCAVGHSVSQPVVVQNSSEAQSAPVASQMQSPELQASTGLP